MVENKIIVSLRKAVELIPDDLELRLHLARQLTASGQDEEAAAVAVEILAREPGHVAALELLKGVAGVDAAHDAPEPETPTSEATDFDWHAAEEQVKDLTGPRFVAGNPPSPTWGPSPDGADETKHPDGEYPDDSGAPAGRIERPDLTLADVGGMESVKQRLNAAFLAPLNNPELSKLYGKNLRGGLLLYGPPGCGKTYIARALAGELGASFLTYSGADIWDPFVGQSEQNVKEMFETARAAAPAVLFLDELDALGQRRSRTQHSGTRGTVNQLLTELDGVASNNEGVFILGATNQPWDVDSALRRPGRFDRTLLVLPPDTDARRAIFASNLEDRPVEGMDLAVLAKLSEGFSGADIAYVCEQAAEHALMDSVAKRRPRLMTMKDMSRSLKSTKTSIGPWLDSARNLVLFGGDEDADPELKAYLRKANRL